MKKRMVLLFVVFIAICLGSRCFAETDHGGYLDYGKAVANLSDLRGKGSVEELTASRLLLRSKKPVADFGSFSPLAIVAGPDNHYTLQFDSVSDAVACMEALKADPNVIYVTQDAVIRLGKTARGGNAVSKAEPYKSWGARSMGVDDFAASINTAGTVTVAVVDSGVTNHPFLNGRVKTGGVDFTDTDYNDGRHDVDGHGTHVAGTIVDLTQGQKINILPVRVFGDDGSSSLSTICNGIRYAAQSGAKVVNMSIGSEDTYPYEGNETEMRDAVDYAVGKGATVVVASGNENSDASMSTPACFDNVIVVAAVDKDYNKAGFSNYGDTVDVCAPGVNILSCSLTGGYTNMSGTSMATPHISAIAAMVKLKYPAYSPARVESFIQNHCKDLGDEGWDKIFGFGMPCFITGDERAEGDYGYRINDGGAFITEYRGEQAAITLPETLGGLPVLGVDEAAFKGNCVITSVAVPECYKEIGNSAFASCERIGSVVLSGVVKIAEQSFIGCTALKNVALPESLGFIGSYAFSGCSALTEIKLPSAIEMVGARAFEESGIRSLTIPASLGAVTANMCENCRELENVTVENGIERIENYAFNNASKLKRISLPKSVETLEYNAFSASGIENIEMPGVTNIGECAFMECPNLESIILPEGLKIIQYDAFASCGALTKVLVPRSVDEIYKPFDDSPNITVYGYWGSPACDVAEYYEIPFVILGYQTPMTSLKPASEGPIEVEPNHFLPMEELYTYEPEHPTDNVLTWISSDASVCGIEERVFEGSGKFYLSPVAEGSCVLTGTAQDGSGLTVKLDIIVHRLVPREVRLDISETDILLDGALRLTASVLPKGANQEVIWYSDDPAVAAVDENGLVTAVSVGSAAITAASRIDENLKAVCTVSVIASSPLGSDFTLRKLSDGTAYITGYNGSSANVNVPAFIDGAAIIGIDDKAFSKSNIVSLAVSEGIVSIGQNAAAKCKKLEKVSLPDSLVSIATDAFKGCAKLKKVKGLSLKITAVGEVFTVTPVFTPVDTASAYSVSVSPKKNARVTPPCAITPLTDDYFTVTVKAGGKKAVIGFKNREPYAAGEVVIKGKAKRTLAVGESFTLSYAVKPETARVIATWSSQDNSVATVAQDGTVTAVAAGKTRISLNTDIGLGDSVTVTVK